MATIETKRIPQMKYFLHKETQNHNEVVLLEPSYETECYDTMEELIASVKHISQFEPDSRVMATWYGPSDEYFFMLRNDQRAPNGATIPFTDEEKKHFAKFLNPEPPKTVRLSELELNRAAADLHFETVPEHWKSQDQKDEERREANLKEMLRIADMRPKTDHHQA